MSRIGNKIKEARLNANMTEKKLAKKLGVSEKFIKDVECGKKIINESLIKRMSKALGKELNDITMSFEASTFEADKPDDNIHKGSEDKKEIWNDAFQSILKTVPMYDYNMDKVLSGRQMPIVGNKIEGHAKDKVLFLKIEDDDMIGYRIFKGDIAFGHIIHEAENNSICLIEVNGRRCIRQIKKLDNNKVLLISNRESLRTETFFIKDIKPLVKLDRVEIKL